MLSVLPLHRHSATRSAALQSPAEPGLGAREAILCLSPAGSRIWVTNLYPGMEGGSVTELVAGDGGWIQTLPGGTWIQSLLRGCIPGVLASGSYHFRNPGLIAAVGTHIWVFGSDGVRVLTDR